MMQLTRKTFVSVLAVALVVGVTLGAFAAGRSERPPVAVAPEVPILPVQMPLAAGTFAKVAHPGRAGAGGGEGGA